MCAPLPPLINRSPESCDPSICNPTRRSLCLLLLRLGCFGRFLAIAPHHYHAQETADDGAAEKEDDDGDADGPDAGWEEGLDRVRVVDEGLKGIC